jgi:hypothetical protein
MLGNLPGRDSNKERLSDARIVPGATQSTGLQKMDDIAKSMKGRKVRCVASLQL